VWTALKIRVGEREGDDQRKKEGQGNGFLSPEEGRIPERTNQQPFFWKRGREKKVGGKRPISFRLGRNNRRQRNRRGMDCETGGLKKREKLNQPQIFEQ